MLVQGKIKVLDVELSRPVNDIEGLEGFTSLKILARLYGRPIGYVLLPLRESRCSSNRISKAILDEHHWAIVQHLVSHGLNMPESANGLQVDSLLDMSPPKYAGTGPLVTVAVCTRDRTPDLEHCLASLKRLNYPSLEILIVDNAPSNTNTELLVTREFPSFRYVKEPRPGLNWARNRAVTEARGKILAFTDDDVVVDPAWIDAVVETFAENSDAMAITGLVVPHELETKAQLLFEEYGGFGCGFERKWYRVDHAGGERTATTYGAIGMMGTGANMAYRTSLFKKIGLFDVALDVGTVTNGGGDLEMFFRVLQEGYTLIYEPAAIVFHRHRREIASFHKQITNNGIGFSSYLMRCASAYPKERLSILGLWIWWLRKWHLIRLLKSFIGKEVFPRELILAEFRGYLVGLRRYQRAKVDAAEIKARFKEKTSGMIALDVVTELN